MITRPPDFIQIPYQLLIDEKITLQDRIVYGFIYWFVMLKQEKCIASNQTIADLVKIVPRSIQRCLDRLETAGYISRVYFDRERKKRSEIIPLIVYARVRPASHTVRPVGHTGYDPSVTRIRKENKKTINKGNVKINGSPQQLKDILAFNPDYSKHARR